VSYLAIAATDSIQVRQTVGEEGDGEEPPEGEGSVGGGIVLPIDATPPEVSEVRFYDITLDSAKVFFRTDEVCLVELSYGKTKAFESGPLMDHPDTYEYEHNFSLEDLDPGTKYYIKIIVRNQKGIQNVITSYGFYTTPEFSTIIPDVGSLSATQSGKTVVLEWKNPSAENLQGVQISRQTGLPALSPDQGEKIFFGTGSRFEDADVRDDTKYFYTVFVFDTAGNFSSGVSISIKTDFPGEGNGSPEGSGGNENPSGGNQTPSGEEQPLLDVRNLKATADVPAKKIILTWEYAEKEAASRVEIRRDVNFPSMSPWEGDLVYSGPDTRFEDGNIRKGQIYFYSVYVKAEDGRYSNGAIIAAELKESSGQTSEEEQWEDMNFIDVDSGVPLSIRDGGEIDVLYESTLGVSYGLEVIPESLHKVAIQLGDTYYYLSYDSDTKSYKTSLLVPSAPGEYPFNVVFLNEENEVFFEKDLRLRVLSRGRVFTYENEPLWGSKMTLEAVICRLRNIFGEDDLSCKDEKLVDGAQVTVYRKNRDNVWEQWNAKEFNQENPRLTGPDGEYAFYLRDGEYEINVTKEGFVDKKVYVSVVDNILNEDIQMRMKKDLRYGIIILILLFIFVLLLLKKRFLNIVRKR